MTLEEYRRKCGWSYNEMGRQAGLDGSVVARAARGGVIAIGSAKKLAMAISRELGLKLDIDDIEGLNVKYVFFNK